MTSTFADVCDAVIDDLKTNVPELRGALVHRYAPWDPEQQTAEANERHLAVWPSAEAADEATPLLTDGGSMFVQLYQVLYWEDAGGESESGVVDERAAAQLLALLEKVRARFYKTANVFLGGTDLTQYVGAQLPERSGQVRWWQITIRIRTTASLT